MNIRDLINEYEVEPLTQRLGPIVISDGLPGPEYTCLRHLHPFQAHLYSDSNGCTGTSSLSSFNNHQPPPPPAATSSLSPTNFENNQPQPQQIPNFSFLINELNPSYTLPRQPLSPVKHNHLHEQPLQKQQSSNGYDPSSNYQTEKIRSDRRKRVRQSQAAILEDFFSTATKFPSSDEKHYLGLKLNMEVRNIQIWFQVTFFFVE